MTYTLYPSVCPHAFANGKRPRFTSIPPTALIFTRLRKSWRPRYGFRCLHYLTFTDTPGHSRCIFTCGFLLFIFPLVLFVYFPDLLGNAPLTSSLAVVVVLSGNRPLPEFICNSALHSDVLATALRFADSKDKDTATPRGLTSFVSSSATSWHRRSWLVKRFEYIIL